MAQETNVFEKEQKTETQPVNVQAPSSASAAEPSQKQPVAEAPFPNPEEMAENPLKRILKIIVIAVVILVAGFLLFKLLSGFFSKRNQKVELTYWGLWEDPPLMQTVISDFERDNPTIHITYTKEDIKQYRQRLTTRISNGGGPDIYRFHNSWTAELSNFLLALPTDVITKDELKKSFYPIAVSDLTRSGGIYGIPLEMDTLSLFINTEIFKAAGATPPTDWNQFADLARSLTVVDKSGKILTSGAALGTFDNITHAPDILSLLFIQNGADLRAFDKFADQEANALTFYSSFATGEGNIWDATLDPSIMMFAKGNLAMYFGYSWDALAILANNPHLAFQVVDVPHVLGSSITSTIASYWVEGISSKSKHQKEAFLLLKYLAKKETELKLFTEASKARLFGEPYARVDLAELLKNNSLVYPFVRQARFARSSYFASDTHDDGMNDQMNAYLGNAVRSILGGSSPQSANATLTQGVLQVLRQFGQ